MITRACVFRSSCFSSVSVVLVLWNRSVRFPTVWSDTCFMSLNFCWCICCRALWERRDACTPLSSPLCLPRPITSTIPRRGLTGLAPWSFRTASLVSPWSCSGWTFNPLRGAGCLCACFCSHAFSATCISRRSFSAVKRLRSALSVSRFLKAVSRACSLRLFASCLCLWMSCASLLPICTSGFITGSWCVISRLIRLLRTPLFRTGGGATTGVTTCIVGLDTRLVGGVIAVIITLSSRDIRPTFLGEGVNSPSASVRW